MNEEREAKNQVLVKRLDKEMEIYERNMRILASAQSQDHANEDNQMFDKKERYKMVKEEAEKRNEEKRQFLIDKIKKAEEIQKERLEKRDRDIKLKKEAMMLKVKNKEENIERHKRKKEHKKELYLQKLKIEKETFDEKSKLKQDLI